MPNKKDTVLERLDELFRKYLEEIHNLEEDVAGHHRGVMKEFYKYVKQNGSFRKRNLLQVFIDKQVATEFLNLTYPQAGVRIRAKKEQALSLFRDFIRDLTLWQTFTFQVRLTHYFFVVKVGIPLIAILLAVLAVAANITGIWTFVENKFGLTLSLPSVTPSETSMPTPRVTLVQNPVDSSSVEVSIINSNAVWSTQSRIFDDVEMVLVPPGCFNMGYVDRNYSVIDAQPIHEYCFDKPYWIDKYEVTHRQFALCVDDGGCSYPQNAVDFLDPNKTNEPVILSWQQAQVYASWRNARLPSEAEWEYAARGPDSLVYPWGNTFDATRLNWCDEGCLIEYRVQGSNDGYPMVAPSGSFPTGASWVGALDMIGNIEEWTNTIYDPTIFPYPYNPNDGRENTDALAGQGRRVTRGCTWGCVDLVSMYAAWRNWGGLQSSLAGVRLVRNYS